MFKDNLRRLRKEHKLSQEELGSHLIVNDKSVSGKTIWSWETGRTEPNMGAVQQLAEYFQISIDELIGEHERQDYLYQVEGTDEIDILTEEESNLIDEYRKMSAHSKVILAELIKNLK